MSQAPVLFDLLRRLEDAVRDLTLMRYISIASLTWLVYDHLLTFEKERSWIWSNKVTLTKVLFLINRYSAPIVMLAEIIQFSGRVTLSDDICVIWLFFEALWQSLSALIVQFLLGLRMSAIWGSRPWTKFVLYGGCLVCAGASITSISVALAHVASTYVYSPQLRICYTTESLGPWLWGAFFLPIMLFDLLIFLLTIWHAALGRVEHRRKGSLTYMMWRDGAIYFALIFASELACVVVSAIWGFNKTMIFKFAVWTIQNVVISHMTLNLVEAVRGPPDGEMLRTRTSLYSPNGRPSMSQNVARRSRRSGLHASPNHFGSPIEFGSPVEFASYPPSPLTIPRSALPNPHETSRTRLTQTQTFQTHVTDDTWSPPYTESTFASPSKPIFTSSPSKSGFSPSKAGYSPSKGKGKQPAVDGDEGAQWLELHDVQPGEWTEMYRSTGGPNEHLRVIAGPSTSARSLPSQPQLQMHTEDDQVLTIGTGNSRLLTRPETRPSVMSRADLDGQRPIPQDEFNVLMDPGTDSKRQTRLNELFEALTSPPAPVVVASDHNRRLSTRVGFI